MKTTFRLLFLLPLLVLLASVARGSVAETLPLSELAKPGRVLMLRHAEAPGVGDPSGFRLDDCATQRNLDDSGRRQARAGRAEAPELLGWLLLGALLTAVFCAPWLGGTGVYDYVANAVGEYSIATQFKSQLWGVVVSLVWSGVDLAIGDFARGVRLPCGLDDIANRRGGVCKWSKVVGAREIRRAPQVLGQH